MNKTDVPPLLREYTVQRGNYKPGGKCEYRKDGIETLRRWVISEGPKEKEATVLRSKGGVTVREGSRNVLI